MHRPDAIVAAVWLACAACSQQPEPTTVEVAAAPVDAGELLESSRGHQPMPAWLPAPMGEVALMYSPP